MLGAVDEITAAKTNLGVTFRRSPSSGGCVSNNKKKLHRPVLWGHLRKHVSLIRVFFLFFSLFFCFGGGVCKSPDTQVLKATSRCGLQSTIIFSRGRCHLLLGLNSPFGCRLGYHPSDMSEAWLVEQKALPPQLKHKYNNISSPDED